MQDDDPRLAGIQDPMLRLILSGDPDVFYRDYRAPSRDRREAEAAFYAEASLLVGFGSTMAV